MTSEHTKANDLYWHEIFENATEPMLVIDQTGRVYEANQAVLSSIGYSREEVLSPGFDLFEKIIHPKDKEQLLGGFAYLIEINEPLRFRLNAYAKDGRKIPTVSSFRKLSRMEGWDTDRFVIAFMDISEFKALERELRSTLDVLGSVLHKAERGDLEAVVPLDHLPERYRPVGETINGLLQEARHSRLELLETLEVLTEALNHTLKGEPAVIMVQRLPERYRPVGETINRLVDETFLREAELKKIKEQLEETLQAQAETIKELSTPVIPVWGRILMAPLLGSFDSVRVHELNETLLEAVAAQKPLTVLLDLSGLAHVDTQVVGELVKLIIAVRILGTQTVLVGIKPHLAQSLVHIGASLENVPTYATLEQGLRAAMARQA